MLKLKEIRRLRGLTQVELVALTGVSLATVKRAEQGSHTPTLENLVLIADALDVTLDDLIGRDTEADPTLASVAGVGPMNGD